MHLKPEYKDAYELTDKMYSKEMYAFAREILKAVETKLPPENKLRDEYGNQTPFGKYVIPLLTSEIARFAVIKAVAPKVNFTYDKDTGEIAYDYKDLKRTSLLGMGIIADCPEDEAVSVINHIRSGIKNIQPSDKEKLASALLKSIKGTSLESFKLAEMIVGRAQAGLDWRIDATKDIGDIESLRNKKTDFEYTWNKVIDFWSKFTDGVKESHPDAYIAAEVTDLGEIYGNGYGDKSGERFAGKTKYPRNFLLLPDSFDLPGLFLNEVHGTWNQSLTMSGLCFRHLQREFHICPEEESTVFAVILSWILHYKSEQ